MTDSGPSAEHGAASSFPRYIWILLTWRQQVHNKNMGLWIDCILDPLYSYEVQYIRYIQILWVQETRLNQQKVIYWLYSRSKDHADFLVKVSEQGDPAKAFYIFFPLFLALNRYKGIKYLGAVVLCEWMNLVLKWSV